MRHLITTLAALTLPVAALSAAVPFVDLRIGGTTAAGISDVEADGTEGEWDDDISIKATALACPLGFGVTGGIMAGGSLVWQDKEGVIDGTDVTYQSTDLRAHVGYGFKPPVLGLHIEALLTLGVAFAELEAKQGGFEADDTSTDFQYGAEANVAYTFDSDFQIGAGLAYLLSKGEYDLGDTIDVEQDEFLVTLFVGYRL